MSYLLLLFSFLFLLFFTFLIVVSFVVSLVLFVLFVCLFVRLLVSRPFFRSLFLSRSLLTSDCVHSLIQRLRHERETLREKNEELELSQVTGKAKEKEIS